MIILGYITLYTTAEIESLVTSPLSNALFKVLKSCNVEQDVLELAVEIISMLAENGLFTTRLYADICDT